MLSLKKEWPVIVGMLGALVLLWVRGEAWVLDGQAEGYRWPDYLYNAWMISLGESQLYDSFRNPLHGYMVGALGTVVGSYIDAAILISSASIVCVVLGGAICGRVLGGKFCGAVVALCIAYALPIADASQWANLYPMLAGGIALCVMAAAILLVHQKGILLAGGVAGFAWATDPRALPFVGLVVAALTFTLWKRRKERRVWGWVGLAFLPIAYGYSLEDGFGMAADHHLQTQDYLSFQRDVVLRRMSSHNNPRLSELCRDISTEKVFSLSLLSTPCGQEMVKENIRIGIPRILAFPLWFTVLGTLLCFVPSRSGSYASRIIPVCILIVVMFAAGTMAIEERYMLLFAGPWIAISVVGFFSVLGFLPKAVGEKKKGLSRVFLAGALLLFSFSSDGYRQRIGGKPGTSADPNQQIWNQSAKMVSDLLPGDAFFIDCASHSINLSLLPRKTVPNTPPSLFKHLTTEDVKQYCVKWIQNPPAKNSYLGMGPIQWSDSSGRSQEFFNDIANQLRADRRWRKVKSTQYYSVYKYMN